MMQCKFCKSEDLVFSEKRTAEVTYVARPHSRSRRYTADVIDFNDTSSHVQVFCADCLEFYRISSKKFKEWRGRTFTMLQYTLNDSWVDSEEEESD